MSVSRIITLAISVAICIVIVMMMVGALNIASPIARYTGIVIACIAGIVIGQAIHRKYVA